MKNYTKIVGLTVILINGLFARSYDSLDIAGIELFASKSDKCQGWQIDEVNNGVIAHHYHADGAMQVIHVTGSTVYFLVPGPYGFDQYPLTATLPRKFPKAYKNKCCWLRKTKNRHKLLMTYKQPDTIEQLLLIEQ